MYRIGIMQGRLSPMLDERIQSFPTDSWQKEFDLARNIGFELIEWVFDPKNFEQNPLLSSSGRQEIIQCQDESKVKVAGVCCDFFMEYPLISQENEKGVQAQKMLFHLIRVSPEIGIEYLELPLIGTSQITDQAGMERLSRILIDSIPLLDKKDLKVFLETDLNPKNIKRLLSKIPSNRIQLCYDMGNSTYWGYEVNNEIPVYGNRIENVHVKDCTQSSYSVPLGQGDVNFDLTFALLKANGYRGDFVLQTSPTPDYMTGSMASYKFTRGYVRKYFL